ncbi:MAM domain-containing protein 2-like isoform X3 [Tubulanus polymorphus]|uniref:MAM domain-containing protein 2-like isoform X3 n=1 Tax=Tubulanus polymorphus TaxID=672921 RepID=UPI003DA521FC
MFSQSTIVVVVVFVLACILYEADGSIIRKKRNALRDSRKLWTARIIPFVFSPSLRRTYTQKTLLTAMVEIGRKTCLKFKPRENEVDYLYYDKSSRKRPCWSNVGRIGGKQAMGFYKACNFRDITHELLHALGFEHEHQRPDRDRHIIVNWRYVKTGSNTNFEKLSAAKIDMMGAPYDYHSIMHYRALDGSKDNKHATIQRKDGSADSFSSNTMTPTDIWKINHHYRCNEKKCEHPGTPEHGILYAKGTDIGEEVAYECSPGYTRVGSPRRTCQFNSETMQFQWSGETPKCKDNVLMYCDFESVDICAWTRDPHSKADWVRFAGESLTQNTGPAADNTLKTHSGDHHSVGFYMSFDSTDGQIGDTAKLKSIMLPSTNALDLSFYLHMWCKAVEHCGQFSVYLRTESGTSEQLFYTNKNQGQSWKRIEIQLTSRNPFWLEFVATRGNSNVGDIAIDDVLLQLHRQMTADSSDSISTTSIDPPPIAGCDFDANTLCDFHSTKSDFEWKPFTDVDEPDHVRTYAVASKNVTKEEKARMKLILTNKNLRASATCIQFSYNFRDVGDDYGHVNADLQVWVTNTNKSNKIWNSHNRGFKEGNWYTKLIEVSLSSDSEIIFEAVLRPGSNKGIGLDDVEIRDGPCSFDSKPSLALVKFDCTFDENTCGWDRMFDSNVKWVVSNMETDMPKTGPTADHTTNEEGSGYFVYLPAIDGNKGDKARFLSPSLPANKRGYCFTFWYHMYGSQMGKFAVRCRVVANKKPWEQDDDYGKEIWAKSGNQGTSWQSQNVFINPNAKSQEIILEGTIGKGFKSDMAFDDVSIVPGSC